MHVTNNVQKQLSKKHYCASSFESIPERYRKLFKPNVCNTIFHFHTPEVDENIETIEMVTVQKKKKKGKENSPTQSWECVSRLSPIAGHQTKKQAPEKQKQRGFAYENKLSMIFISLRRHQKLDRVAPADAPALFRSLTTHRFVKCMRTAAVVW